MSEPRYLSGDPATYADMSDGVQELECDQCQWVGEIPTTEEYLHGQVYWEAEWVCPNCMERHDSRGDYDPNDNY